MGKPYVTTSGGVRNHVAFSCVATTAVSSAKKEFCHSTMPSLGGRRAPGTNSKSYRTKLEATTLLVANKWQGTFQFLVMQGRMSAPSRSSLEEEDGGEIEMQIGPMNGRIRRPDLPVRREGRNQRELRELIASGATLWTTHLAT
uniref:Uncharacterized protein n=1 Tax=Globodera rostochiensis TaxID=31243 RepID=A0A914H936_GLORO